MIVSTEQVIEKADNETQPPAVELIDWLIVMGGPMGIAEEGDYPWLAEEKTFIKQAIDQGKRVLGICLGAQLIANVLGAAVYPNREKEIGRFPVYTTEDAEQSSIIDYLPRKLEVFHWHGNTFDIPTGAVHLLYSTACSNQAFLCDDRVLALQFHLETTPESVAALRQNCAAELTEAPFAQKPAVIMSKPEHYADINRQMNEILDYLSS